MNAIIVCVDYWKELSLTLPHNAHHFKEVFVLTSPKDFRTQFEQHVKSLTLMPNVTVVAYDGLYDNGSMFNKWGILEKGLREWIDVKDWICVMDADIFIPRYAGKCFRDFRPGNLYTPFRRMNPKVEAAPNEDKWDVYPRHRNQDEWAGYMHVFHGSDPVLEAKPWYDTGWKHAGGGDTVFQRRWERVNKIRPYFEVLHIGMPAVNWCGRTKERQEALIDIWRKRRSEREMLDNVGAHPDERISRERS